MWRCVVVCVCLLMCSAAVSAGESGPVASVPDPVLTRLREHVGVGVNTIIQVVDADDVGSEVWQRVKSLVAFRIHRHAPDGTTLVDPAIYLVANSALYFRAAAALRHRVTNQEYVWCLFAAVLAHEGAHTRPKTERQALTAEAAQLRRCLSDRHLSSVDGLSAVEYLVRVEAKLRKPREHY